MGFWRNLSKSIIERVIKPELEAIRSDLGERITALNSRVTEALTKANAAVTEVREMRKQMTALQALDIGFQEQGKVIVLAHIGGKDRVKIIETKREMSPLEYKRLAESIKRDYGAEPKFVDAPMGADIRII